jgi:hypothetical protein
MLLGMYTIIALAFVSPTPQFTLVDNMLTEFSTSILMKLQMELEASCLS